MFNRLKSIWPFKRKEKTNTPVCYLICGFIGAGKSTYSKKLALQTGATHLNTDEWCMKLFSPEEYQQNWSDCFVKTVEYLWTEAAKEKEKGNSVIFDMGFWTKQSRKYGIKKATKLGFIPKIHYVYAPDKILKERISKRGFIWDEQHLQNFDKIKLNFQKPRFSEKYVKIKNY